MTPPTIDFTRLAANYGLHVPIIVTDAACADALLDPRVDSTPSAIDIDRFMAWLVTEIRRAPHPSYEFYAIFQRIDGKEIPLRCVSGLCKEKRRACVAVTLPIEECPLIPRTEPMAQTPCLQTV